MIRRLIPSLRASQKTLRLQVLCFRRSAPPRLILRARQALRFLLLPKPPVRPPDFRVRLLPARALRLPAECIRVQTPTVYHRQSICLHSIGCLTEARCRPRRRATWNRYPYSPTDRLCRSATRSYPARRGCFRAPPLRVELCQVKSCSAYRKVCFPLISPQFIYAYMLKNRIKVSFCVSPLRT